MATTSWQAATLVQCVSTAPWLTYPGCDEPGGCHDLTLGKIYEMLGLEGKGSFYRIVDDSGEDYLYPALTSESRFRLRPGRKAVLGAKRRGPVFRGGARASRSPAREDD